MNSSRVGAGCRRASSEAGGPTSAVIHGVQHVMFPVTWLEGWPDDSRESKLVFITQGLDRRVIQDRIAGKFGRAAQPVS